jgi:hypothetical protein
MTREWSPSVSLLCHLTLLPAPENGEKYITFFIKGHGQGSF